ncbi:MAG: hypothetical protein Q4A09_04495 [Capnocytophaga felis]|nr:hypothetical protein [Capnocytophaga felis]
MRYFKISVWWYLITAAFVGWYIYDDNLGSVSFWLAVGAVCLLLLVLVDRAIDILKRESKLKRLRKYLDNISDKSIAYSQLKDFVYLSYDIKKEIEFVREKLKEIINLTWIKEEDFKKTPDIIWWYHNDEAFLDVYDLIVLKCDEEVETVYYGNYEYVYNLIRNLIYHLKDKHPHIDSKIRELNQKLERKINQIIKEYNENYPYGDKPCYAKFEVGMLNKRTKGGAVYYDEQNAIGTTLYVFDDIIEIHNHQGIKKMNINNIVKIEESYRNVPVLIFPSTGGTINLNFLRSQEWYFIKLMNMLKSK